MNQDRLMKFVPAGVVLAAAVFLGIAQAKVESFDKIYAFVGYGAVIALLALTAVDYRRKLRIQGNR